MIRLAVLAGFVNQRELGRWYTMADALVFPSCQGETWGLVVNEAFQFGLTLLVSDHAGSARDLVAGPWSPPPGSCVFRSGEAAAFAAAIRAVPVPSTRIRWPVRRWEWGAEPQLHTGLTDAWRPCCPSPWLPFPPHPGGIPLPWRPCSPTPCWP